VVVKVEVVDGDGETWRLRMMNLQI
jgi:hypothetical protein